MQAKVGVAVIELAQADITDMETDALVNAANNHLWMGAGVAGAIKRKGGVEIETEAMARGPIPVGTAIATSGGRLAAKYVIHAATMGQDLATNQDKIRAATASSLAEAHRLGLESIAFPALGAGVGGFSLSEVAGIMLDEVERHLRGKTTLRRVVFALYGTDAYRAFELELKARGLPSL